MYTSLEYVIVHKVDIYELNRFGSNWRTQTLVFKLPGDKKRLFSYHVTNKIDISHLKKGIGLNLIFMFSVKVDRPFSNQNFV